MATVKGRILLGWMTRDEAVHYLLNNCAFDPPIDAAQAEAIWRPYRDRVKALPERPPVVATRIPLDAEERLHAAKFIRFMNGVGPHDVREVVKIDLRQLAVHQYYVLTDKAANYAVGVGNSSRWLEECLPTVGPPQRQFNTAFQQIGMGSRINVPLPHAEFFYFPQGITEALRYVTIAEGNGRTYLSAGYHRTFAKFSTTPIATVPVATVALVNTTFVTGPTPNIGVGVNTAALCIGPGGIRPAYFSDFFTDGLFMDVDLKKKRWELQIVATNVALDDPT